MLHPISSRLQGVFIPVSDLIASRDWYCQLLNLRNDGEIYFGHIYVLPLSNGIDIILDSKIYRPEHVLNVPLLQIATDNIKHAWQFAKDNGMELVTEIENQQWFNLRDPDGNMLMICQSA